MTDNPDRTNMIVLDLNLFTRLAEVQAYAEARGMVLGDAVRDLVNAGLSHERQLYRGRLT
jgi:hypothetical protein